MIAKSSSSEGVILAQEGYSMSSVKSALFVGLVILLSTLVVPQVLAEEGTGDGDGHPLLLVAEVYEVLVMESYAVTEITRVFENPTEEAVDHVFDFLIPMGALISNFSLLVDGTTYYADVLEKDKAEEKYQQAVANGTTAGLVTSYGDSRFGYKVSFAPGELMTATLRYEQVLLKTNGWHTVELLMTSTNDTIMPEALSVHASISAPEEIDTLETTGYEDLVESSRPSDNEAHVTVDTDTLSKREDLVIRWRTGPGSEVGKMYFHERDGVGYFVHVFDPDPALYGPSPIPKDFIFVMDKSGSMKGQKFSQSQQAMRYIYQELRSSDRFSFVEFNTHFDTYSDELLSADDTNKNAVVAHILTLAAGGGTNIHSAVVEALDIFKAAGDTMPVIVLLSDGNANSGLYHRSQFRQDVLEQNTVDASIFCIALGDGADWNFLEALAIDNDGRAIWVHEDEAVVLAIQDFVASFSDAILADLTFEYGPDVWDVHPEQVRAHYEGGEVLVTGRVKEGASELDCRVTARSPQGDVVSEGIFPVEMLPGNDFVPRFWAYQRIKELEDSMKVNGTDNGTIAEIVDLATEFHFATDHTSLFVELPEELKEQWYGDEEPAQPYIGLGADLDADALQAFSRSMSPGGANRNYDPKTGDVVGGGGDRDSYPAAPEVEESAGMAIGFSIWAYLCVAVIVVAAVSVPVVLVIRSARGRGPR